jgi:hypothetical protein
MKIQAAEEMTVTPPVDGEIRVNGGQWTRLPVVVKSGDRVETRPARMPDAGQGALKP